MGWDNSQNFIGSAKSLLSDVIIETIDDCYVCSTFENVVCKMVVILFRRKYHKIDNNALLKILEPSDTYMWQWIGSPLVQVLTYFLLVPSHYLNQCYLNCLLD